MLQMDTQKITVMLVDDHALLREGVRNILNMQADVQVIGEVADGEEALHMIPRLHPHIVLLDVNLPSLNGIQVISQLKAERDETAIIVLTVHDDREQMIHALRAGAAGFCAKDVEPQRLVEIIRHVAAGCYVVDGHIFDEDGIRAWIDRSVEAITNPFLIETGAPHTPLSRREMEILEQITLGLSNQEVAIKLRISHQTVKNHMTAILRKLNVQDRTQAAVYALRQGWVRVDKKRLEELGKKE